MYALLLNTMELALVTFDQAKKLKDLGFDVGVHNLYHFPAELEKSNNYTHAKGNWNLYREYLSAPTVALALMWLRKEFGLNLTIQCNEHSDIPHSGNSFYLAEYDGCLVNDHVQYNSYEDCESKGLDYALIEAAKLL